MAVWVREQSLVRFFILAAVLSWLLTIPMITSAQGWTQARVPFALHYLTAFEPMLSACLVTGIAEGRPGLRGLFVRIAKWHVELGWIAIAVFSRFGPFAVAFVIAWASGSPSPDLRRLGEVNYLPYRGVGTWFLWFLNSAVVSRRSATDALGVGMIGLGASAGPERR